MVAGDYIRTDTKNEAIRSLEKTIETLSLVKGVNAGIFLTSRAGLILTIFGRSKIDHPDHHGFTASVGGTGKNVPPAFLRSFIR